MFLKISNKKFFYLDNYWCYLYVCKYILAEIGTINIKKIKKNEKEWNWKYSKLEKT